MTRESHGHRRRTRRHRLKSRERNFLAAVGSMVVIVTLSTALAEPRWFSLHGGSCKKDGKLQEYLGVTEFFNMVGKFETLADMADKHTAGIKVNEYFYSGNHKLTDCVTPVAVTVLKFIIALCFVGILLSFVAFILDLLGPTNRWLKFMRRHGLCNIFTVLICVTINGFCYWCTTEVEDLQKTTKLHQGSKVSVAFDISFYLVAGAGALSVITTGFNLLCIRCYIARGGRRRSRHRDPRLLDDYDDFLPPTPEASAAALGDMSPPPAYEA